MKIIWHGHSCFSVESAGSTIVFDPYIDGMVPGLAPLRLTADAVFCSHEHDDHNARSCVQLTGKSSSFSVTVLDCFHDDLRGLRRGKNKIHIVSADGLRLAHMGDLGHTLSKKDCAQLENLDALLIPVGGFFTIDAKTAKSILDRLSPRVVIPMHYRLGKMGFDKIAELSEFTALCDNVVWYPENSLELAADTPRQTAVLTYAHE